MVGSMYTAASALRAHSAAMNVTANNIANINTHNYTAKAVTLKEMSPSGVQVSSVSATKDPLYFRDVYYGSVDYGDRMNNVELSRERLNEISSLRSYQANAVTVRTADEMLGTIINLKA